MSCVAYSTLCNLLHVLVLQVTAPAETEDFSSMSQPAVPAYHPAYRPDIYSTPTPAPAPATTPTTAVQHTYPTSTPTPAAPVQHSTNLVLQQGAEACGVPTTSETMEYRVPSPVDLPSPSDLRKYLKSPVSVHLGEFTYTEFEDRERAPHVLYNNLTHKYTYKNLAPLDAIEDLDSLPVGEFAPQQYLDASCGPDMCPNLNVKQADGITDFDIQNVPQILPDVIFADSGLQY